MNEVLCVVPRRIPLIIVALFSLAAPVWAGPLEEILPPPLEPEPGAVSVPGRWDVHIENDLWGGSDENYTSGFRTQYLGSIRDDDDPFHASSLSLGHQIFTPADIETSEIVAHDRPYAGWLYLGLQGFVIQDRMLETFSLELGVTGEPSLAEPLQKFYHDFSDIEPPRGWDNQIKTEPGIILSYERRWKWLDRNTGSGWGASGLVYGGVSLGNIITHAKVGGELRAGWNMLPGFGHSTMQPGSGGQKPYTREPDNRFSVFGFIGLEGRAVARNIFLDGNTFTDSPHTVDKEPLVADAFIGIGARWGRFEAAFTEIFRTREFQDQEDPQPFGALTFSLSF